MEVVILDKIRGKPELPFQIPLGEFTEKSDPPWDSVLKPELSEETQPRGKGRVKICIDSAGPQGALLERNRPALRMHRSLERHFTSVGYGLDSYSPH